jgi:hypothetical protein
MVDKVLRVLKEVLEVRDQQELKVLKDPQVQRVLQALRT